MEKVLLEDYVVKKLSNYESCVNLVLHDRITETKTSQTLSDVWKLYWVGRITALNFFNIHCKSGKGKNLFNKLMHYITKTSNLQSLVFRREMEAVTKQNHIDLVKKYHGNFMVNSKGLHINAKYLH